MAQERATRKLNPQRIVPADFSWQQLLDAEATELKVVYTQILVGLAQEPGTLGTIFRNAQNRIQDSAKPKRLIVGLIDQENWPASGTDLKGPTRKCWPRAPLCATRADPSRALVYGREVRDDREIEQKVRDERVESERGGRSAMANLSPGTRSSSTSPGCGTSHSRTWTTSRRRS